MASLTTASSDQKVAAPASGSAQAPAGSARHPVVNRRIASAYANVNSPIASSPLKRSRSQRAPHSYADALASTPSRSPLAPHQANAPVASVAGVGGSSRLVATRGSTYESNGGPSSPNVGGADSCGDGGPGRRGDINSPLLMRRQQQLKHQQAQAGRDGVANSPSSSVDGPGRAAEVSPGTAVAEGEGATDGPSLLSSFFSPVLTFFGAAGEDDVEAVPVQHEHQGGDCKEDSRLRYEDTASLARGKGSTAGGVEANASGPGSGAASTAPVATSPSSSSSSPPPTENPRAAVSQPQVPATNQDEDAEAPMTCDEEDDLDESYEVQEEFNPYVFIKNLPPYNIVRPSLRAIPHLLPPRTATTPKVTLVLDLDETLVHCSIDPIPNADLQFPVDFNGVAYRVYVRKRPHFAHFIEQVSKHFEVVVFTASQQVYAERLLNILDPDRRYIAHRLYRDACLCVDGNYLKDLNVLGRDMRHTVLVDNSPYAFGYQVDNGIPIESWFDDDNDRELLKLLPFLDRLLRADDVRDVVRSQFKLRDYIDNL